MVFHKIFEVSTRNFLKKLGVRKEEIERIFEGDLELAICVVREHFNKFSPRANPIHKSIFLKISDGLFEFEEMIFLLKKIRRYAKILHFLEFVWQKRTARILDVCLATEKENQKESRENN